MTAVPNLIALDGTPLTPAVRRAASRPGASMAAGFRGASWSDPDLAGWTPGLYSPHAAYAPDRLPLAARIHDLARNDGWVGAGVSKSVDAVIGANWMLFSTPNARALGLSPDTCAELAQDIESAWADFADDHDFWIDAGRRLTFGGILALAFRHRIVDGEALGGICWEPDRAGPYATCVHVVHPDRLTNPDNSPDAVTRRMGVELGSREEPIGYWIRAAHPGDAGVYNPKQFRWDYWPRETAHGRRLVFHAYEPEAAGQFRGQSALNSLVKKLRMLGRYDEAELQAAVLNAIMAAMVESPYDQEQLAEAMAGGEQMSAYQKSRIEWYQDKPLEFGGAKVGFLHPGEKVSFTKPTHPNSGFEHYFRAGLRNVASVMGLSYEQLSADWSQVNYSSARAAILEVWRGFSARREVFANQVAQPIYAAWLEEAIDKGRITLPKDAPDFYDRKAAYCAAEWIGPARGWVDPMKEAEASMVRMSGKLSSLRRECAEQGRDYRKVLAEIAREQSEMIALGIDPAAIDTQAANIKGNVGDQQEDKPVDEQDGKSKS